MGVILIVDDEPVVLLTLGMMLQRVNHTVVSANDGQDALSYLKQKSVDLVMADVNMPRMGGLTLLRKLRADKRYRNLPFVIFTANGSYRIRQEAARNGATEFLVKPISSLELRDCVHKCLMNVRLGIYDDD